MVTITRWAAWVESVPERPRGAVLSRRWTKREWLLAERDRLIRAACGDWQERVREVEGRIGHDG